MRSVGAIALSACVGLWGSGCSGEPESYGHGTKRTVADAEEGTAVQALTTVRSDMDYPTLSRSWDNDC